MSESKSSGLLIPATLRHVPTSFAMAFIVALAFAGGEAFRWGQAFRLGLPYSPPNAPESMPAFVVSLIVVLLLAAFVLQPSEMPTWISRAGRARPYLVGAAVLVGVVAVLSYLDAFISGIIIGTFIGVTWVLIEVAVKHDTGGIHSAARWAIATVFLVATVLSAGVCAGIMKQSHWPSYQVIVDDNLAIIKEADGIFTCKAIDPETDELGKGYFLLTIEDLRGKLIRHNGILQPILRSSTSD